MKALPAFRVGVLLVVAVAGVGARPPQTTTWKTFRSETYRYTVRYPSSWHLFVTALRPKLDYLDILSFPPSETWKGVVIREGGAEVTVGRAPENVRTPQQWIARSRKFDTDLRQEALHGFTRTRSGCLKLLRATSFFQVGPGAYQEVTDYYCSTRTGLYGVELINWKDDPKQKDFRRVALKIALSLRSW